MTLFDERERAFENMFAHEEELRFLARARRNRLFASWAAEQLGLRGDEFRAYVRSFAHRAVRADGDEALIERVRADFVADGVETSEERIRGAFLQATAAAVRQVRTEVRDLVG